MTEQKPDQYIITEKGLAELDKYFIGHKDSLIKIAWKNLKDKEIRSIPAEDILDKFESRYTALVNEKGIQGYPKILERNVLSNLLPLLRQYEELRQGNEPGKGE